MAIQLVHGEPFLPSLPWSGKRWVRDTPWDLCNDASKLIYPTVVTMEGYTYLFHKARSFTKLMIGDQHDTFAHQGTYAIVLFYKIDSTPSKTLVPRPIWLSLRVSNWRAESLHSIQLLTEKVQSQLTYTDVQMRTYRGILPLLAASVVYTPDDRKILYSLFPTADTNAYAMLSARREHVERLAHVCDEPLLLRSFLHTSIDLHMARGQIIHQLLEAVHFLHGRGILHGDIKLENVLLTTTHPTGAPIVHLCDLDSLADLSAGRCVGGVRGTIGLLSPERVVAIKNGAEKAEIEWTFADDRWATAITALSIAICGFPDPLETLLSEDDTKQQLQLLFDEKALFTSLLFGGKPSKKQMASLHEAFFTALAWNPSERSLEPLRAVFQSFAPRSTNR